MDNCCEGRPYYNACKVCLIRRHRWLIKQLKEKEAALARTADELEVKCELEEWFEDCLKKKNAELARLRLDSSTLLGLSGIDTAP